MRTGAVFVAWGKGGLSVRTVEQLVSLTDSRALVTGGAGHIGFAVSAALVELGARIAVLDRERQACDERSGDLNAIRSGCAISIPCDLANECSARQAVRETIDALGGLDIVVHCAAYVGSTSLPGWAVPFESQTVGPWEDALRVNLTSAFVVVQEARKALCASGRGSVILMASIYGLVGPDLRLYQGTTMGNPAGYGVSKGGLLQLTRYLSTVLAPEVRVNAISPGGVWRHQPESFVEQYVTRTPLRRMATEEDLKGAVAFLASDLSAYVTGQNLIVDGGWTAW